MHEKRLHKIIEFINKRHIHYISPQIHMTYKNNKTYTFRHKYAIERSFFESRKKGVFFVCVAVFSVLVTMDN